VKHGKSSGFTLIELMIVIAIVAILAVIAVPAYNDSVTKARRADGMSALMDAMARQERFFTENNTYTTNLAQASISGNSPEGFYTLAAAACGAGIQSCVIVTATPTAAQAHDGPLTLNSRGQRTPTEKW
jgi:type IV pilus assembly protein PilE